MSQALGIGWTRSDADARILTFRRVFGLNLILMLVIALVALFAPLCISSVLGLPDPSPSSWVRAWGGMVLLVTMLYVPGYLAPFRARWAVIIGIAGRFGFVLLYLLLGGGFLWLALFELVFGIVLAALYFRAARSELMCRP